MTAFPDWAVAPYANYDPEYARSVQAEMDAPQAEPVSAKRARVSPKCRHCLYRHDEGQRCVWLNHNYMYSQPKHKVIVQKVLAAPALPPLERAYLKQGFRPHL